MQYIVLAPKKPENIALSFSGGGFRAASYALGCLSYMETIQLDAQKFTGLVQFISSASGGTITNLAYTQSQRKGISFDNFYKTMKGQTLAGSTLLNRVFEIMTDKKIWKARPLKSRNLINAFSIAYDEILFNRETFGIYWDTAFVNRKEVCANTTEFDDGMLFRFQNVPKYGNYFLNFKSDIGLQALQKIKLGDILAASSCFPVGFEPFMFPVDFTHADLLEKELQNAIHQDPRYQDQENEIGEKKTVAFGLMDGGIDDNQGIASFMLAEARLQNRNGFGYDLYLACDVSSNYTAGFDFPEENKKSNFLKPSLLTYLILVLLFFTASLAGIFTHTWSASSYSVLGITGLILVFAVLQIFKGFISYRKSSKTKDTTGLILYRHILFFLKLRLSTMLLMLNARAQSTAILASVVFLKKIRRSSYDRLYEKISEIKYDNYGRLLDDDYDEALADRIVLKHWKKFALQNAIYLLSPKNDGQREKDLKKEKWFRLNPSITIEGKPILLIDLMKPSSVLQEVACLATEMDTTLWFDENHINSNKPAALIATGQLTTCYNLLRYSFRFDSQDPYWAAFQNQLANDWNLFNQSPYWLYNIYEKK